MFSTASWSAGQDAPVPVARGALPLLLPLSDPPARRHRPPVEMGVQTSLNIQVLQQRAGRILIRPVLPVLVKRKKHTMVALRQRSFANDLPATSTDTAQHLIRKLPP